MSSTTAHAHAPADPAYARGVVLVLLAGCFWSIGGPLIRLIDEAGEWQILFYRSIAIIVMLLGWLAIRRRGAVLDAFREAGRKGVLAGACIGFAFVCFIFAMTHTTIANALFVLAVAPFIAALLARVILGEGIRPLTWVCMIGAVAGVGVMVAEGVALGTLSGNLFALGAATGFALFSVTLRAGRAVDMTPAVCWAGVFAAVAAAGVLATRDAGAFAISGHDLTLSVLMGCAQIGLGLILFAAGSRHVPAAELALLSLTEVVLGPILVWGIVGELPGTLTLIGGVIVLGAIVTQALGGIRRRPPVGVV